ncbi:STAS domain-containing protein [Amycolatopsis acidiphila]|nr:STAS domain-containing protein [Amycolatopsis acidiphila]UIJ58240.1 STAS domain-containing protein [Amycolatopsis acidiphila]GHG69232.1 hypothetical protein GCM10017788_29330 [Amycolatopsis acidiphila]
MLEGLEFSRRSERGATTVVVAGELDAFTAPSLANELDTQLARAERDVVVDVSEVTFMSGAGLEVLMTAAAEAAGTGIRMRVRTTGSRAVERVLEAAGGEHLLPRAD